jgi:hypothetical protein
VGERQDTRGSEVKRRKKKEEIKAVEVQHTPLLLFFTASNKVSKCALFSALETVKNFNSYGEFSSFSTSSNPTVFN